MSAADGGLQDQGQLSGKPFHNNFVASWLPRQSLCEIFASLRNHCSKRFNETVKRLHDKHGAMYRNIQTHLTQLA